MQSLSGPEGSPCTASGLWLVPQTILPAPQQLRKASLLPLEPLPPHRIWFQSLGGAQGGCDHDHDHGLSVFLPPPCWVSLEKSPTLSGLYTADIGYETAGSFSRHPWFWIFEGASFDERPPYRRMKHSQPSIFSALSQSYKKWFARVGNLGQHLGPQLGKLRPVRAAEVMSCPSYSEGWRRPESGPNLEPPPPSLRELPEEQRGSGQTHGPLPPPPPVRTIQPPAPQPH